MLSHNKYVVIQNQTIKTYIFSAQNDIASDRLATKSHVTIEEINDDDDDDEVKIVGTEEPVITESRSTSTTHISPSISRIHNRRAYRNPTSISSRRPIRPTSSPLASSPPISTSFSSQPTRFVLKNHFLLYSFTLLVYFH